MARSMSNSMSIRLDRLQCDRRDRRGVLAAPRIGGDIGQLEELPPGMGPSTARA